MWITSIDKGRSLQVLSKALLGKERKMALGGGNERDGVLWIYALKQRELTLTSGCETISVEIFYRMFPSTIYNIGSSNRILNCVLKENLDFICNNVKLII